jgi:Protein of unknown function (DUF3592)
MTCNIAMHAGWRWGVAGVLASAAWIVQTQGAWAAPARSSRPDVVPTLLTVALVASAVFGLIAIWSFYTSARQADRAGPRTLWRVARGQIHESRVVGRALHQGGGYFEPVVNYSYVVSGRQYFGDTIEIDAMPARRRTDAERIIARYRPGSAVNVRYNPENPSEAELVGASTAATWRWTLGTIMGGIAAVWFLFFIVALMLRIGGII